MSEICRVTLRVDMCRVRHPRRIRGIQAELCSQKKLLIDAITLFRQSLTPFTVALTSLGSPSILRSEFPASLVVLWVVKESPGRKVGARSWKTASPAFAERVIGWPPRGNGCHISLKSAPTVPRFKAVDDRRPPSLTTCGRTAQKVNPSSSFVSDDLHCPGLVK